MCVLISSEIQKSGKKNSFCPCRVPENSQTLDYFFTLIWNVHNPSIMLNKNIKYFETNEGDGGRDGKMCIKK